MLCDLLPPSGLAQRFDRAFRRPSDCHPLHAIAATAITAPVVHISVAIRRIGSVRRLSLALWPLDAGDKGQHQDTAASQLCRFIDRDRLDKARVIVFDVADARSPASMSSFPSEARAGPHWER